MDGGLVGTRQQWEYKVEVIKNPDVSLLQDRLNRMGADGWEIVSGLTTVKTWINLTGNDLVFVLKRPGVGSFTPRPEDEPGHVAWA
jgi:hypothetical protein